ncbi:energy transducer TonB [Falsihalocynthiibacter sp. SS001]|uniref:energy transducer TonB n=1 Tax=Falsihalocynthiibacter sp. SS001 TaxID=3349698 RepID=UPI0036D26555
MRTGLYISGAGHTALIVWILFGGLFLRADEAPTLENTQVSLITAEEFAAMSPPEVPADDGATPPPPQEPAAEVPTPPEPEAPVAPSEPPSEVVDQAPSPIESPEPLTVPLAPLAPTASPRPSERVAPQPVITEEPNAVEDTITQEATETVEAPEPEQEPTPEVEQTTAPEEASDRIVAEADAPPASAPDSSRRPPARPERPAPQEPEEQPEPEAPTVQNDDILAALNEANQEPAPTPSQTVPSGPPLSQGEKDALRLSVGQCWNVGTLSAEALRTTVVVGLNVGRDGVPESASLRMISSSGGSQASARQAYEAARRAILRCGAGGFDLPAEKYDHWKEIEITFDPEKMRNR